MFAALLLPLLAAGPLPAVPPNDPPIELWISNDGRFLSGDAVKIHVRTDADGYVVVLHADPEGRVRVLFPLDPRDDNFVRGGKRYELHDRAGRAAFEAGITGRGTVYAAVSRDPLRFDRYVSGDHWDYRVLAPEALPREPEAELTELVRDMARANFDYDVLPYDVVERGYAAGRPGYRHWNTDVLCDPYYYHDYYCRPHYGSYLSVNLLFGRPYRRAYYGYNPYYYDPFYYRPAYVYPTRYYGYYPYRSVRNNVIVRGRGDEYRDRRFTFAGSTGDPSPRRILPSAVAEARGSGQVTPRAARPTLESRPAERRNVEARRARPAPARASGEEARPAPRVTENKPSGNAEARGREPQRAEPRRSEPRREAEPRQNDGGGSRGRVEGRESRPASPPARVEGRSGGGGRRSR